MSSKTILKELADKLKPTVKIEDADYQLLSALYELYFGKHSFTLPINGEVARQGHVTAPLSEIERQDIHIQELLGQLLEDSETVEINTAVIKEQILHQLNYLKSEVDNWRLQKRQQSEDIIEFFESFAPGVTLPIKTPQNHINQLSQIDFVPGRPVSEPENEILPERFYSFGQPFIDSEPVDPVAALKNNEPLHLQGIILTKENENLDSYLQETFESINSLHRIISQSIIWYQKPSDDPDQLSIDGYIRLQFQQPVLMSYIDIRITPESVVEHISIINIHGQEKQFAGGAPVYFEPDRIQEIRISLNDSMAARRMSYPLKAYIIRTASINDGGTKHVFYRDYKAREIEGAS